LSIPPIPPNRAKQANRTNRKKTRWFIYTTIGVLANLVFYLFYPLYQHYVEGKPVDFGFLERPGFLGATLAIFTYVILKPFLQHKIAEGRDANSQDESFPSFLPYYRKLLRRATKLAKKGRLDEALDTMNFLEYLNDAEARIKDIRSQSTKQGGISE